ncbi:hypothetical protein K438DRAFT_1972428 [Mycena galopus ATCC 62051]|nr:hypothetical protein K438DRAFT_1972428 [Mycena galopus ATCC 62051]
MKWLESHVSSINTVLIVGRLRRLHEENSALHAKLTQTTDTAMIPRSEIEEEAFLELDVYDDCDVPLTVVSGLLIASSLSVTADFVVGETGGLARTGDAEKSDVEEKDEATPPVALGRGQRKKTGTSRYQGLLWEE